MTLHRECDVTNSNVIFTGTFCALNKGDAAMQLSAHQALRAAIPGVDITIHTPFPDIDRPTYREWTLFETCRRRALSASVLLLRAGLWGVLKRYSAIRLHALIAHPELQQYQQADAIIDLSGDTITDDYGLRCLISHLIPVIIAICLQRPIMLCAQTLGPFGMTSPLARWVLKRVTLISVREDLSYQDVKLMGVDDAMLHRTADIAFLLQPVDGGRVDEIFEMEGLSADQPLVGVTTSRLLGHRFDPRNPQRFETLMAEVVRHLLRRYGVHVVLLSHVSGPGPERDDRVIAKRVASLVSGRDTARLHVLTGDYRPDELKGVIGRCELFLSLRMHANIASLSMEVPTFAVAYSRKT